MKTLIIDGAAISGMDQIHGRFYAMFDFPECYGENLDDLHEYLNEVKYDALIRITNNSALSSALGQDDAEALRRILSACSTENPHLTVELE